MTLLHRIRFLLVLGLLICLAPRYLLATSVRTTVAHAASAGLQYRSATYGYSLRIPAGWVRVPHVRWTPGGPPADLTIMPPDHQAALGVVVTPTGNTVYSATDLQNVAARLIAQESYLPSVATLMGSTPISHEVTKKQVINHVTYQIVSANLLYGGHMVCSVEMTVAVTQQHHRLYAVAAIVYAAIFGLPPGGGEPTDTPVPGDSGISPQQVIPAVVATAVPSGLAPASSAVPAAAVADAGPVPLPTDRERGNLCRTSDDVGLIFLDKNCAAGADTNAMLQAGASMRIAPQAATDRRAAAVVGADGFATYVDPGRGALVRYPAQWTPVAVSGAVAAVESPDQNSLIALFEQPITASSLSSADLQSIANQQIGQIGSAITPPVFKTIRLGSISAFLGLDSAVGIDTGNVVGQAQVTVVVAVIHQRICVVRAATLVVSSSLTQATVIYPYFTPFTTLARRAVFDFESATVPLFSRAQDVGLGFASALSLAPVAPA